MCGCAIISGWQELLRKTDVLEQVKGTSASQNENDSSFWDGTYYYESPLLSEDNLRLTFVLYTEDFEISHPLGLLVKQCH